VRSILLAVAAVALAGAAHAQDTYRWVDKDGRVQYGNQPPAGVKATKVQSRISTATSPGKGNTSTKPAAPKSAPSRTEAPEINLRKKKEDSDR
jgi:hypothetical protein